MVRGARAAIVRERQDVTEIWRGETIPRWMKQGASSGVPAAIIDDMEGFVLRQFG